MSFDLYREEVDNRLSSLRPVANPEPGVWDNFTAGTGKVAMQTFAKAGRAASMAAAPLAMALEKAPGSTEVQDKFFKAHDEIFGRAVDYWTPKPGEVGEAGMVVGSLLGTLPLVFASPAAAVASTQLSAGEDLVRKGVDAGTAQAVGASQAVGLGLGIWVPILGKTLAQRVLLGGAGFNVVQGTAMRGAGEALLEGTPGEKDYQAFDPTQLTLDVLLGAAFGGLAHVHPRMRAEGDAWHKRMAEWGAKLKPSEVDALAALRQSQHLNADSMPGKPVDVADTNAHVDRMRQAIDDLANDRPVNVEDMPAPRFEADAARAVEANAAVKAMQDEARAEGMVLEENVLPKVSPQEPAAKSSAGSLREAIQQIVDLVRIDDGYEYGLRVIPDDMDGDISIGDILPHSRKWDFENGRSSEENAEGASAISVMHEDASIGVKEALALMGADGGKGGPSGYYFGKKVVLVRGDNVGFGDDAGEVLIRNPEVVGVFEKAGKGKAAILPNVPPRAKAAPEAGKPVAEAAEPTDPITTAAARFASENPDLPIMVGKNADGSDITTTPRQWLEDADAALRQANDDVKLFEIAAGCLLGGGR